MREDLQGFLTRARAHASPAAAVKLESIEEQARASPRRSSLLTPVIAAPSEASSASCSAWQSASHCAPRSASDSTPRAAPRGATRATPQPSAGSASLPLPLSVPLSVTLASSLSVLASAAPTVASPAPPTPLSKASSALERFRSLAEGRALDVVREVSLGRAVAPAFAGSLARALALAPETAAETAAETSPDHLADPSLAPDLCSFAALRGRLVELSGDGSTAVLTRAVGLVLEAQRAAEPVGWICLNGSSFYPPDVVECGVDLAALAVIRVPDGVTAGRTAERLLRSSAFGLVILDLGAPDCVIQRNGIHKNGVNALSIANQGRLVTLAQHADSLVVFLTSKNHSTESLGSLISLRADASRKRVNEGVHVTLQVLKDKRRGPGWSRSERAKGPSGLT